MKNLDNIGILFKRQSELDQKAKDLREERDRIKRRLIRIEENMLSAELESEAIKDNLLNSIELGNISVRLRIVEEFTHVREKRLMLEVNIDGLSEPLFKMLSNYEIDLLNNCHNINDKLVLESRLKKMAKDFIEVHEILPDSRGYELNSSMVLDEYIGRYNLQASIDNIRNYINID